MSDAEAARTELCHGGNPPVWNTLAHIGCVPARFKPFTDLITALQESHNAASCLDTVKFLATFQEYARADAAKFGLTVPGDTAE